MCLPARVINNQTRTEILPDSNRNPELKIQKCTNSTCWPHPK